MSISASTAFWMNDGEVVWSSRFGWQTKQKKVEQPMNYCSHHELILQYLLSFCIHVRPCWDKVQLSYMYHEISQLVWQSSKSLVLKTLCSWLCWRNYFVQHPNQFMAYLNIHCYDAAAVYLQIFVDVRYSLQNIVAIHNHKKQVNLFFYFLFFLPFLLFTLGQIYLLP